MKKVILFNILITFIGIVAIELFFGSWLNTYNYGYLTLPRNYQIISDTSDLYDMGGKVSYTRDENGFRGHYNNPSDIDFLVLGGSTTNEMYVDDCCIWTNRLAELAKKDGHDISVVNAGIDGQSVLGHVWNFDNWFPNIDNLSPKYVIAYFGINEQKIVPDLKAVQTPQHKDFGRQVKQYVRNNSAIYHLYKTVKGTVAAHRANLTHHKINYKTAPWESVSLESYRQRSCDVESQQNFRARLDKLYTKITDLKATPIFATQRRGDSYIDGETVYGLEESQALDKRHDLDCFNQITREFCAEKSIKCVDASEIPFKKEEDFYDYVHTTPVGSQKIAAFFYKDLKTEINSLK
ncbi:SGNH/GDSL hydrolase family protein [Terasakiella pusilla]|uniref:SGNH/GDSL hydrolase family protein n=1 Tax=Terasakiella pusilla TaxID=64973 RepID=UPI003AA9906B